MTGRAGSGFDVLKKPVAERKSPIAYADVSSSVLLEQIKSGGYASGEFSCRYLREGQFYRTISNAWIGENGSFLEYFQRNPPHLLAWGRKHLMSGSADYASISIYLPDVNPILEAWNTLNSGTYGYGTHWDKGGQRGIVKPYVWRDADYSVGITYIDGTRLAEADRRNVIVLPQTDRMHSYTQPSGTLYHVTGLTAIYSVGDGCRRKWDLAASPEELYSGFKAALERSCGSPHK
jgi:hypothetical protein